MSLPARDLLARIADGAEATIHSVFRSAINIRTESVLLTIAPDAAGGLPCGILLDETTPLPDLRHVGVEAGMPVGVRDGFVGVPSTRLAVDLRGARSWSPRTGVHDGTLWAGRSSVAWSLLEERATPGSIGSLASARGPIAALIAAIEAGDRDGAARAAWPLVGLGPGLTPSGDDLLAGVEAGLRALRHPVAGFVADILVDVDARTTSVSATLLRLAARGEFAERIASIAAALLEGPAEDLPAEIDRAVAWGATSGSDTLNGILNGFDAATASTRRLMAVRAA